MMSTDRTDIIATSQLNVELFRDIAKKSLVDALNAVGSSLHSTSNFIDTHPGQWSQDVSTRFFDSWSTQSHNRSVPLQSMLLILGA